MLGCFSGSIIPCNHTCWFRSLIWSVCCRRRFYSRRRWSIICSLKLRYSSDMRACRQICKFLGCSCKCRGLGLEWNLLMDRTRCMFFMFGTLHIQVQSIRHISHRIHCILSCICIRHLLEWHSSDFLNRIQYICDWGPFCCNEDTIVSSRTVGSYHFDPHNNNLCNRMLTCLSWVGGSGPDSWGISSRQLSIDHILWLFMSTVCIQQHSTSNLACKRICLQELVTWQN